MARTRYLRLHLHFFKSFKSWWCPGPALASDRIDRFKSFRMFHMGCEECRCHSSSSSYFSLLLLFFFSCFFFTYSWDFYDDDDHYRVIFHRDFAGCWGHVIYSVYLNDRPSLCLTNGRYWSQSQRVPCYWRFNYGRTYMRSVRISPHHMSIIRSQYVRLANTISIDDAANISQSHMHLWFELIIWGVPISFTKRCCAAMTMHMQSFQSKKISSVRSLSVDFIQIFQFQFGMRPSSMPSSSN